MKDKEIDLPYEQFISSKRIELLLEELIFVQYLNKSGNPTLAHEALQQSKDRISVSLQGTLENIPEKIQKRRTGSVGV